MHHHGMRWLVCIMLAMMIALNGVPALAATDLTDAPTLLSRSASEPLRLGSRGSEVRTMQQRLKELGYLNDSADGVFGPNTEAAVKAFQKNNSLVADGVVGTATRAKLNSDSAKAASGATSGSTATDDGTLRSGSTGSEVKKAQQRLKELGYYTGSIDGVYGSGTIRAVKAFQGRNGLTVDGVCGSDTLKRLYASSANGAQDDVPEADEEDSTADDTTLRSGSTGSEVKKAQQRLKELGYYTGSIDGVYGSGTIKAVKAFQGRNGLTVDGVCGSDTLKRLYASSANGAQDDVPEADEEDSTADDTTLRSGSTGDAVKEMQYRLKELGYYTGSRDGAFGAQTEAAVKAFQASNGLKADGIAGPDTLRLLYSDSAVAAGSSSGSADNSGSASGTTTTLRTNQTLRPGDDNEQVRAMQVRLAELGYYTNTIDGDYGYGTRQAVLAFQKNNGLTQDGIAGQATLEKLVSASAVGKDDIPAGTLVTERLDWYADGVDTFPRSATIRIKDCRTGLVFSAKVLYGSNHLDAEPLTAADTRTLLEINGGEAFSYRRRPVLVQYNGHVYAASIYSEPHGEQTITNNNFDGQFCLHFYGSKTHGTGRVDADHQRCEAEALQYSW